MNSNQKGIYYLYIYNKVLSKEIGNYINYANGSICDFEEIAKYLNNKEFFLPNHFIYKNSFSNVEYTLVVKKTSPLYKDKSLCVELIERLEHQGVRNMITSKGELTSIGKKYLYFSIEQFELQVKSKKTIDRLISNIQQETKKIKNIIKNKRESTRNIIDTTMNRYATYSDKAKEAQRSLMIYRLILVSISFLFVIQYIIKLINNIYNKV